MTEFVNFLGSLFNEGLQYRSINTIRSAVSVTHQYTDGSPIGKHPLVTRLMKGIYNSQPPTPRHTLSWDAGQVISYLKSMGPSPSLKNLTLKLTMLMALVDANRTSELAALDLQFKSVSPDRVSFSLGMLMKKRKVGAPPPQHKLIFGGFSHDKSLCVVACLSEYEARTREFRNQSGAILILCESTCPSFLTEGGKWLKMVLREAGINTSDFSANSEEQLQLNRAFLSW